MTEASKIIRDEEAFSRGMEVYLKKLQKQAKTSKAQAKKDAIEALKRTGVIEENGEPKERIVSWE